MPRACMNTVTVSHRGRVVALAAPHRFWLAADIEMLPDGHRQKRFVAYMVLYARDVLIGELPGPYSDEDAERFAQLTPVSTFAPDHPAPRLASPGLAKSCRQPTPSRQTTPTAAREP